VVVLTTILLFANSKPVLGQTTSLSVWPPLIEVVIQPGNFAVQKYRITNNSDFQIQLYPQIFPFVPLGKTGQIKIIYSTSSKETIDPVVFSFENNYKFNQPITLLANETKEISLKIGFPRKAEQKDYYYTLLFSTSAKNEGGQSQSSSVMQIGTNILITASETEVIEYQGEIVDFKVPKIIDSFSPVKFILELRNKGRAFFKPFGKIFIIGALNQKFELNILEQNVLASFSRLINIGNFKPKFPIGPFNAKVELKLNDEGEVLSESVSFWYLPYKLFFILTVAGTIIIVLKKNKKKVNNKLR
jgi:hypothetical protein